MAALSFGVCERVTENSWGGEHGVTLAEGRAARNRPRAFHSLRYVLTPDSPLKFDESCERSRGAAPLIGEGIDRAGPGGIAVGPSSGVGHHPGTTGSPGRARSRTEVAA